MTTEIDGLFSRLERNRFAQGNDPNSVLDAQQTGIGSVNPTGFVSDLMQDGTGKVVNDGSGILVKDGDDTERVRLGKLATDSYGLRVTNPAGTVIVDGTSNMFKIVASGSISRSNPGPAGTYQNLETIVTLTGLGVLDTIPAHLSFVGASTDSTDVRHGFAGIVLTGAAVFVALSSGGSPTFGVLAEMGHSSITTRLNASDICEVKMEIVSVLAADTVFGVYHVLQEAAL